MPYRDPSTGLYLNDGLYLVMQPSSKLVDHYGVLDVGNTLGLAWANALHPVVIHQTPPSVRVDWLGDTGCWQVVGCVPPRNLDQARERVKVALGNQDYAFFFNNCEQFARFIVEGRKYSTQLQAAGVIGGLAAIWLFSQERE